MNSENDIPALCSLQGAPVAKQQTNAYGVCAMAIAEMLGYATKDSRCAELRSLHDKALFHKQALAKLKEPKVNHSALGGTISTRHTNGCSDKKLNQREHLNVYSNAHYSNDCTEMSSVSAELGSLPHFAEQW